MIKRDIHNKVTGILYNNLEHYDKFKDYEKAIKYIMHKQYYLVEEVLETRQQSLLNYFISFKCL